MLTAYLAQVRNIENVLVRSPTCESFQTLAVREVRGDLEQVICPEHIEAVDQRCFRPVGGGHNERSSGWPSRQRRGQRPAHGTKLAGESELSQEFVTIEISRWNLLGCCQNPERNRQVEAATFLGQIRGREIYRYAARRKFEARVE